MSLILSGNSGEREGKFLLMPDDEDSLLQKPCGMEMDRGGLEQVFCVLLLFDYLLFLSAYIIYLCSFPLS